MFNLKKYQQKLPPLEEHEATLDYLVPTTVWAWGELVGHPDEGDAAQARDYRGLASTVAQLLQFLSIDTVSEDAVASASHKWTKKVDPWVAIGTRVESLHRAYRQQEDVRRPAESLWAALEFRAPAITGQSLAEVLK